jgi:dienelactone hydrolase
MLKNSIFIFSIVLTTMANAQKKDIRTEKVTYLDGNTKCMGYISYDHASAKPIAAILVVPEWWGCNEYAQKRATMLAELGYIAMAVDMYGEGKQAADPKAAGEAATPFYKDPALGEARIAAALAQIKTYKECDPNRIAAIGYCFGGSMVLNAAKLGMDLKAVVSFHGGLQGVPAVAGKTKARILVCHGMADKFVSAEEVAKFKANLVETKTPYQFLEYKDATHAFTNPAATANGLKFSIPIAYNEAADKKSWADMQAFMKGL